MENDQQNRAVKDVDHNALERATEGRESGKRMVRIERKRHQCR